MFDFMKQFIDRGIGLHDVDIDGRTPLINAVNIDT